MWGLRSCLLVVLVGWLGLLASCYAGPRSTNPDTDPGAATTTTTGEGGSGGGLFSTGGAEAPCVNCVQSPPVPFERLAMFWIGAPADVPDCPPDTPLVGFQGVADLVTEPHSCPECSCSPAWCALPEAMHVSAAKCPGDAAPSVEWSAEPGWEGVCTGDAIPAGTLCGGVPCTQSVTVSALTVEACKPSAQGSEAVPAPAWGTMARECLIGPLYPADCTTGEVCAPSPPEGFAMCLFVIGAHPDLECPAGFDRGPMVLYDGWADDRACAPCACGEAVGAECEALISIFKDGACGEPAGSVLVPADEPACVDVPSGTALGSKSAALLVDEPGSCTPAGGAVGAVAPTAPVTLCCQPAAGAAPAR